MYADVEIVRRTFRRLDPFQPLEGNGYVEFDDYFFGRAVVEERVVEIEPVVGLSRDRRGKQRHAYGDPTPHILEHLAYHNSMVIIKYPGPLRNP